MKAKIKNTGANVRLTLDMDKKEAEYILSLLDRSDVKFGAKEEFGFDLEPIQDAMNAAGFYPGRRTEWDLALNKY